MSTDTCGERDTTDQLVVALVRVPVMYRLLVSVPAYRGRRQT